jgi:alpha-beta hydrolase superfamily lysophospholipase
MIACRASLVVALVSVGAACERTGQTADRDASSPAAAPPVDAAAPPEPPPYARAVDVPNDVPAFVVPAPAGARPRIVFLHGACTHGLGYVQAFQFTGHAHGGVVGVQGDRACAGGPYRIYTWDVARQHARIQAALTAAGGAAGGPLVLVGYSQGAAIAEALVARYPETYPLVVLIAPPSAPSPVKLARARAAVMVSGEHDVPARMREAARAVGRAGVPSRYVEMKGGRHGQLLEGEALMGGVLDWLEANARPSIP